MCKKSYLSFVGDSINLFQVIILLSIGIVIGSAMTYTNFRKM